MNPVGLAVLRIILLGPEAHFLFDSHHIFAGRLASHWMVADAPFHSIPCLFFLTLPSFFLSFVRSSVTVADHNAPGWLGCQLLLVAQY